MANDMNKLSDQKEILKANLRNLKGNIHAADERVENAITALNAVKITMLSSIDKLETLRKIMVPKFNTISETEILPDYPKTKKEYSEKTTEAELQKLVETQEITYGKTSSGRMIRTRTSDGSFSEACEILRYEESLVNSIKILANEMNNILKELYSLDETLSIYYVGVWQHANKTAIQLYNLVREITKIVAKNPQLNQIYEEGRKILNFITQFYQEEEKILQNASTQDGKKPKSFKEFIERLISDLALVEILEHIQHWKKADRSVARSKIAFKQKINDAEINKSEFRVLKVMQEIIDSLKAYYNRHKNDIVILENNLHLLNQFSKEIIVKADDFINLLETTAKTAA